MADLHSVEFLGVGVAAIFVSIFWGGSVSVRALLVVAAGVAVLDFLRPVWQVHMRSKYQEEDELSAKCSSSFTVAAFAAAVKSSSAAARSTIAVVQSLCQHVAALAWFQFLVACLAAFLTSCTVKALGIPGYPWNCLLLGVFHSWCFRRFAPAAQGHQCSDIDVGDCPYTEDFWKELGTTEKEEDEEELADDIADTFKLITGMGDNVAFSREDTAASLKLMSDVGEKIAFTKEGDQEEASTEDDKADEEEEEEEEDEEENEEEEDGGDPYEIMEGMGDGEVYNLFEKLTIAYNLFEHSQTRALSAAEAVG